MFSVTFWLKLALHPNRIYVHMIAFPANVSGILVSQTIDLVGMEAEVTTFCHLLSLIRLLEGANNT